MASEGFDTVSGVTSIATGGEDKEDAVATAQKPRFEGDLYTPRIVRGCGRDREAKCHICDTDKWLNLKTSAYWYHMQYYHGISSASGLPFFQPSAHRWTVSLAPSTATAANGAASNGSSSAPARLTTKTRKASPHAKAHPSLPTLPSLASPPGVAQHVSTYSPIMLPSNPLVPFLGPLPNPHLSPLAPHQPRIRTSVAIEESVLCPHCNEWIVLSTVRRPSRYDLLAHIMAAAGMPNADIRDGLFPSEIAAARDVSVVLNEPPLGFVPTNCRGTGGSSVWFRHAGRCIVNEDKA
ncbi:hypothetical protein BCR44DRAFT_32067 [Catenaria anguillulae PL171]|uniref:Transcription regulator Rua1 C-terminal domain-containing protein n=1 Tax=Catenaria anguillulae PL171 TaxID=765915 RepID=A0A1Y2HKH1_9FUNG|nr:hypothetical protein BCR44DRAFT_32067 [Catenaria anguillulae PL171]